MAKSIYLFSTETYSGKSLISVGLGLKFKEEGYQVGYFKPFGTASKELAGKVSDEDAYSIKGVLGLQEPMEVICPVPVTAGLLEKILNNQVEENFLEKIGNAFNQLAKDKEIVFIDGAGDWAEGQIFGLSPKKLVEITRSQVLFVSKYKANMIVDPLLVAKEIFEDDLLGVVINYIPRNRLEFFEKSVVPYLAKKKIETFALFPKDVLLAAVTVKEIVERLNGRVLCGGDKLEELVENFTVGAMHPEQALKYFRKIANKAVITGGDRVDIQMVALETPTKCLILTGNLEPSSLIISKGEDCGVPMILVPYDTFATVELLEEMTKKIPFHGERKTERVRELFRTGFDFKKFKKLLKI